MANFGQKLRLILWKNWIIRKYHFIVTILELVTPVVLFLLYSYLVMASNQPLDELPPSIFPAETLASKFHQRWHMNIYYTPVTNTTQKLVKGVEAELDNSYIHYVGLSSEAEMETLYQSWKKDTETIFRFAGIVFQKADTNLVYKLRVPYLDTLTMQSSILDPGFSESYFSSGFPAIQWALDKSYIKLYGKKEVHETLMVQMFPLPAISRDTIKKVSAVCLPILTVLSFIFLCPSILKRVVEEKSSGVRELMKLMGLKTWMCWLGWLLNALLPAFVSITLIVVFLKVSFHGDTPPVLDSCGGVLWCFLMLYFLASVFLLFAISAVFQRPTVAMMLGIVVWILSFVPGYVIPTKWSTFPKVLLCILPNTALHYGFSVIFNFETNGQAFQFSDLAGSGRAGVATEVLMWHVWLMLLLDIILFYLFTVYWESVFPGEYGIAKPWYYPCMMSTWKSVKVSVVDDMEDSNLKNYESCTTLTPGIQIKNLRKEFGTLFGGNSKVAVDGVTLDVYQNQITALLGHNGAGKSTTMLILTGMYSPSSGSIFIDGHDVRYDMNKVRESLGLCPQQNMLFMDLTVRQHLVFFAMLKGYSFKDASKEADELLKKLALDEHQVKRPPALSGGMKRRLCLGIALCGNPKVVILDEPTSGLDPEARRQIWDLLLTMRGKRTIIITTHIMEEADVLGDRIAIMDHGRIQCYGTSIFLKKLYGTGYHLQISKEGGSNGIQLTDAVQTVIPQASIKSSLPTLVTYNLPSTETSKFPALFAVLEQNKASLGIQGIGVSITTLEEVFLKVGENALQEGKSNTGEESPYLNGSKGIPEGVEEDRRSNQLTEECLSLSSWDEMKPSLSLPNNSGISLMIQQIGAQFMKRWLYLYRSWVFYAIQAALQVVLMAVITMASVHQSHNEVSDSLTLTLDAYGDTTVLYTSDGSSLSDVFSKVVRSSGGVPSRITNTNITDALLQRGTANLMAYQLHYVAAAEFNLSQNIINALYSDFAVHSIPISINLISNTLLKNATSQDSSITVKNHPFPEEDRVYHMGAEIVSIIWRIIPVVHIFWTGVFMILPMKERASESKQIQRMTGVSPLTYWFTYFVWDGLLNLLVSLLMVIAVVCVDTYGIFSGGTELGVLLLILSVYGLSAIPFSYLISFTKDTIGGCYGFLVMFVILFNVIFGVVVLILAQFAYTKAVDHLVYLYYFVPVFSFSEAMAQFSKTVIANNNCKLTSQCSSCEGDSCGKQYPYIETSGDESEIFQQLLYMGLCSILYFFLVLIIDYGVLQWLNESIKKMASKMVEPVRDVDSDVYNEEVRIQEVFQQREVQLSDDTLLVNDLIKKYNYRNAAVKGVSFGVLPGECFGLLGVNGAGKTTTFKMLTGGALATYGDAAIGTYTLSSHKSKYLAHFGYCPQYDPLIECFTGNELLTFFAHLRGVPRNKIPSEVNKWITLLDLTEHESRHCGTYSGGNKRKLSTAIALIGNPPVVFLDEPTSGVDPMSRRKLWTALLKIQKAGQSIVLTSHSMEECEALCNRLAIMVEGKLQCLGTIQHLKHKFGQGFTVKIKLELEKASDEKVRQLKTEMLGLFQSSVILKDEHHSLLHYHVTNPSISWSQLFTTLEKLKNSKDVIEDYTISETTLEQVFLSFAKGIQS